MDTQKMFFLLKLLILSSVTYLATSSCTFPSSLQDDWESSVKGAFTINSTHMTGYEVYTYTDLEFRCEMKLSNYYVLRSEGNITILGADTNAVVCLKFVEIEDTTDKYLYYELTAELSDADYERMKFIQYGTSVSINDACDDQSIEDTIQEAKLMIKDGSAVSERTTCPDDILGYYNYSATSCTDGIWDVCTDNGNMQFTYSDCNETQAYSANGSVYCVYDAETSDGDYMVYVYNDDITVNDSTTFRFTCMVLSKNADNDNVSVTQNANECYGNQTSTYIVGGSATTLTADYTCVPTDEEEEASTASAGLVAGLAIFFVLLVAVGIVAGIFIYIKKFKKVDPRVIDREKEVGIEKERALDTVTPSVVQAEMDSSRNGGTHGKLAQVLGPEYTMSNATDENKASVNEASTDLDLDPLESARKLPPIETGNTPREAMSPLDTQLQKPTLPAIS